MFDARSGPFGSRFSRRMERASPNRTPGLVVLPKLALQIAQVAEGVGDPQVAFAIDLPPNVEALGDYGLGPVVFAEDLEQSGQLVDDQRVVFVAFADGLPVDLEGALELPPRAVVVAAGLENGRQNRPAGRHVGVRLAQLRYSGGEYISRHLLGGAQVALPVEGLGLPIQLSQVLQSTGREGIPGHSVPSVPPAVRRSRPVAAEPWPPPKRCRRRG